MRSLCSTMSRSGGIPNILMPTHNQNGGRSSPVEAELAIAGAFIPDAGAIERLAHAFFLGLTDGARASSPAAAAALAEPWSAPAQPAAQTVAGVNPIQPPF